MWNSTKWYNIKGENSFLFPQSCFECVGRLSKSDRSELEINRIRPQRQDITCHNINEFIRKLIGKVS